MNVDDIRPAIAYPEGEDPYADHALDTELPEDDVSEDEGIILMYTGVLIEGGAVTDLMTYQSLALTATTLADDGCRDEPLYETSDRAFIFIADADGGNCQVYDSANDPDGTVLEAIIALGEDAPSVADDIAAFLEGAADFAEDNEQAGAA